ncbi:MAG: hypothetical protein J6M23_06940 [Bacteroidales bacterium]|nr:hypothetical protein [Bacteroidales bacterium]
MKTFILEWDPVHSSTTEDDFLGAMLCLEWGKYQRSFQEKPEARSGDNFFLLRTGTGNGGIVAKGFFLSDPYEGNKSVDAFRMDLRPTFMVSWEHPKGILSIAELRASIADFPWGESGNCAELPESSAKPLSVLWDEYVTRFTEEDFEEGITVERSGRPEAGIEDAILIAAEALYDIKSHKDGRPAILSALERGLGYNTDKERICSILNDVMKLTDWNPGRLREKGFSEIVVDSIRENVLHHCNPTSAL